MSAPRLLDLFCCEGGAGAGYARAGFEVVGVDFTPQRRYPFEFHQGDALAFLLEHGSEFDAVHASPPCQAYSITRHSHSGALPPRMIDAVREALIANGKPWVIENVAGARSSLREPLTLCGSEFNLTTTDDDGTPLRLERHRLFESSQFLIGAGGCAHNHSIQVAGAYGGGSNDKRFAKDVRRGGYTPSKAVRGRLLEVEWMTMHGQAQCVPPAYTEFIGAQLMGAIREQVTA